jgi:hypothetical protein
VEVRYSQLGMGASGEGITATDMWRGVPQPGLRKDRVGAVVPRHGVVLLHLARRAN